MASFTGFAQDKRGSIAILAAFAMIPLVGTVALAVDYSKAVSYRQSLQQVIDSAATALAKDTDTLLLSASQLDARAVTYAKALSSSLPLDQVSISAKATKDTITINSSTNVPLAFARILGAEALTVAVSVTVDRAKIKQFEIALALDNTGSMAGEKITQLKAAVKNLADYMADKTKNPGTTKISLVPFGVYVRTDPAWMPNSLMASNPPRNWNGCVTDRDQPHDVRDTSPVGGSVETRFHWEVEGYVYTKRGWELQTLPADCGNLAKITPLTSDMAAIKNAADSMIASGNTNVPIGVAWAWHSLSASLPLSQGSPEGADDLQRVMIVLTDGQNTRNRWTSSESAIDARLQQVCSNAKAAGILIYTIRVIDGNAAALQNCATTPTHYYNVTQASQLTPVFEQIASSLSLLRITK